MIKFPTVYRRRIPQPIVIRKPQVFKPIIKKVPVRKSINLILSYLKLYV